MKYLLHLCMYLILLISCNSKTSKTTTIIEKANEGNVFITIEQPKLIRNIRV